MSCVIACSSWRAGAVVAHLRSTRATPPRTLHTARAVGVYASLEAHILSAHAPCSTLSQRRCASVAQRRTPSPPCDAHMHPPPCSAALQRRQRAAGPHHASRQDVRDLRGGAGVRRAHEDQQPVPRPKADRRRVRGALVQGSGQAHTCSHVNMQKPGVASALQRQVMHSQRLAKAL